MTQPIEECNQCRICGSPTLVRAASLGNLYVSNFLADGETGIRCPLDLLLCHDCGLVQLSRTVDPALLYSNFWYESGISSTMRKELADIVQSAMRQTVLEKGDRVLDIGSNDGTLLMQYPPGLELRRIGFEPAPNVAAKASPEILTVPSYFSSNRYPTEPRPKIITAIAMFYDLPRPDIFVRDIRTLLPPGGVFIVQMNYLGAMIDSLNFDNIVHEHLGYYSLTVFDNLMKRHKMETYRAELNAVNGGSIRCYVARKGEREVEVSVDNIKDGEHSYSSTPVWDNFNFAMQYRRDELRNIVLEEHKQSRGNIWVLGASTRGNTLLQYCGIDDHLIKGAVDSNPAKWGRRMVGSNIPIHPRKDAGDPDSFLVLPYHFLEEFQKIERDYLSRGGKFIVPLPVPRIVPA